jgi:phosphoserine aminotransferase
MAYEEACKLKHAYSVATTAPNFTHTPPKADWEIKNNTTYLYYVPNETINGVRFNKIPAVNTIPLIADMTSCLLSEPINVADFGLIFAGAQKNISIAGLTIVIVRNDLLKNEASPVIPTMLDYRTHVMHDSLYATPPGFNCYIAHKMFQWIKAQGGVEALYQINRQKAAALYEYIDESSFYTCRVEGDSRSIVNVCFSIVKSELEAEFVKQAKEHGLYALQGHRTVGGLRASLYNAMPIEGVKALISFMQDFSKEHSK